MQFKRLTFYAGQDRVKSPPLTVHPVQIGQNMKNIEALRNLYPSISYILTIWFWYKLYHCEILLCSGNSNELASHGNQHGRMREECLQSSFESNPDKYVHYIINICIIIFLLLQKCLFINVSVVETTPSAIVTESIFS